MRRKASSLAGRRPAQAGDTAVEILVGIGLLGVLIFFAWPYFMMSGVSRPVGSPAVQSARTLAISEFQYANDHDGNYPDKLGGDAADIAKALAHDGYVTNLELFYLPKSREVENTGPYSGLVQNNISFDFAGWDTGTGVPGTTAPDALPLVWSSFGPARQPNLKAPGTISVPLDPSMAFGTAGFVVCYKSNRAKFIVNPTAPAASRVPITDSTYPGCPHATVLSGGG